jgi:hypothetical protein
MGFGAGGTARFLPVLPNAAWFFFGSEQNYLSLHDDQTGNGFHVKTFRSPLLPSVFSLFGLPVLPFLIFPLGRRLIRRLARCLIKEDGKKLGIDYTSWQEYRLNWQKTQVIFSVNGENFFTTKVVPRGRLGIVIWIDNQYFRFDDEGRIKFGFLSLPSEQWMAIRNYNLLTNNQAKGR